MTYVKDRIGITYARLAPKLTLEGPAHDTIYVLEIDDEVHPPEQVSQPPFVRTARGPLFVGRAYV